MESCINGKKHKFEARYEELPNPHFHYNKIRGVLPESLKKLITLKHYVRDVCVKCGNTIERQK